MTGAGEVQLAYIEAVNRHDLDAVRNCLHPEYTYSGAGGPEQPGPDAGVEVWGAFVAAFSDLRIEVLHQHVAGDVSVIEVRGTGTNDGALRGMPATGRSVSLGVCIVIEVRDGKVFREREYFDAMTLMRQLGAVPEPEAAAAT